MRASREIALTSAISHLECIVNSNDGPVDSATRSLAGLDYALSTIPPPPPTAVSLPTILHSNQIAHTISRISRPISRDES